MSPYSKLYNDYQAYYRPDTTSMCSSNSNEQGFHCAFQWSWGTECERPPQVSIFGIGGSLHENGFICLIQSGPRT